MDLLEEGNEYSGGGLSLGGTRGSAGHYVNNK